MSGGNSANLPWALEPGVAVGRVDHLRLGESVLLGREPLQRTAIEGLHTDAAVVVGEVIESKAKPSGSWGDRGQTAFGHVVGVRSDEGGGNRVIVALGRQDLDTDGIVAPAGFHVLGASSDHLVLSCAGEVPPPGAELRFGVNYSALMRAAASPFVSRRYLGRSPASTVTARP